MLKMMIAVLLIITMQFNYLFAEENRIYLGIVYNKNNYIEDEKRQNYFVGKKNIIQYVHSAERMYTKLMNVQIVDKFIFNVNIKKC